MSILDKIKGNPFEKLNDDQLTAQKIQLDREKNSQVGRIGHTVIT